jgi:hypothetical protein
MNATDSKVQPEHLLRKAMSTYASPAWVRCGLTRRALGVNMVCTAGLWSWAGR